MVLFLRICIELSFLLGYNETKDDKRILTNNGGFFDE